MRSIINFRGILSNLAEDSKYVAYPFGFSSPFIHVYPWSSSGFGTKFANPSTTLPGSANSARFSNNVNVLAVGSSSSPYVVVYDWSSSGFGSKKADPANAPTNQVHDVEFSINDGAIAMASPSIPFTYGYPWSSSGFGTKFANPSSGLPNGSYGIAFNSNSTVLAFAHLSSPYVSAYRWTNSTGFGTKFANPSTLLPCCTNHGRAVDFTGTNSHIALAHVGSPYISVYNWSNTTGFGTKISDPATLPPDEGLSVRFNMKNTVLAVANRGTPGISFYNWSSSGFGTKYATPADIGTSFGRKGVAFSLSGKAVTTITVNSGHATAYNWTDENGFGSRFTNPSTSLENSNTGSMHFSKSN